MRRALFALAVILAALTAQAQDIPEGPEPPMTPERIVAIAKALDGQALEVGSGIELTIADVPVLIVMDADANRIRAMVPIASAAGLAEADLMRMMQANFDTTLDARYAVARGRLWAVYIHPLAELERAQFISGLAQTVNLARTYGTAYSGGAQVFGGGDSRHLFRDLFEDLLERGEEL